MAEKGVEKEVEALNRFFSALKEPDEWLDYDRVKFRRLDDKLCEDGLTQEEKDEYNRLIDVRGRIEDLLRLRVKTCAFCDGDEIEALVYDIVEGEKFGKVVLTCNVCHEKISVPLRPEDDFVAALKSVVYQWKYARFQRKALEKKKVRYSFVELKDAGIEVEGVDEEQA